MIIILTNFKSIIGRVVILLAFLVAIYMIAYHGIIMNNAKNGIALLYLLTLLLGWLSINVGLSFFGIIKVEINNSLGQITLIRFYSKKIIAASEIAGYYKTYYNTNNGTSYGIIIKTKDNKIKELNPGNLKVLIAIDQYLGSLPIEYLGEKRSFYPLTSGL